jgi:valyl-tRNA synthetase
VILPNTTDVGPRPAAESTLPEDRWILSRVGGAVADVTANNEVYHLGETCDRIYHLFWDDYCSRYLEVVKPRLWGDDAESKAHAQHTMLRAADAVLRLLHPLMPFVTEALWQELRPALVAAGAATAAEADLSEALITAAWPKADDFVLDAALEATTRLVSEVTTAINAIRADTPGVAPGQQLPTVILCAEDPADLVPLRPLWPGIQRLAKVAEVTEGDLAHPPPKSAAAVAPPIRIFVPLEGLIDLAAERARLDKKIQKLEKTASGLERKLANEKFTANAPPEVVEKERTWLAETRDSIDLLKAQRTRLAD